MLKTVSKVLCVVALIAFGISTATWAAPKPPVPATIALTAGSDTSLGGWVLFDTSVPKSVEKFDPRVQVLCYQDNTLVYGEAGPRSQAFLLGGASSAWLVAGGPAHCVADLYYWSYQGVQKFNWLATVEFDASA